MPTTADHSRETLLALVGRSPACVAAHDREGWLGLFSDDAVVEDPAGSAPAPKADGTLGRFYDTFIAPHDIRFEIRRDHFIGNDVFRDAIIHTGVTDRVHVDVAAYLLYQAGEVAGELRVRRMAAHWTLGKMTGIAMRMGPRAWLAMTRLFARMIRRMGFRWVGAYLASLWRGIGRKGLRAAEALSRAIEARDASAAAALFVREGATIDLGERRVVPDALIDVLPAGCRLRIDSPVSAGWTTSFRFALDGATPSDGLCLLEFDRDSRRIRSARFFPPQAALTR